MNRNFNFSYVSFNSVGYLRMDDCDLDGSNIVETLHFPPTATLRMDCSDADGVIVLYGDKDKEIRRINLNDGDIVSYSGTPLGVTPTDIIESLLPLLPTGKMPAAPAGSSFSPDAAGLSATLYVEQKYVGPAGVTISLAGGLVSSNASYNSQLAAAKVNDPSAPYPCIWSAQNAAKALIAGGSVPAAVLVMARGYHVTIGSPVLTQNGTENFATTPAANQQPDIMIANVIADIKVASLGQRNISYVFLENTNVVNVCKAYAIPLVWLDGKTVTDTSVTTFNVVRLPTQSYDAKITDWSIYKTGFYGKGQFRWLYGEMEGFAQCFFKLSGYPGFSMVFEADLLTINYWNIFTIDSYTRLDINIDKLYTYPGRIGIVNNQANMDHGLPNPELRFKCREFLRGPGLFTTLPTPSGVDYWMGFALWSVKSPSYVYIDIKRFVIADTNGSDGTFLRTRDCYYQTGTFLHLNIDEFHYSGYTGPTMELWSENDDNTSYSTQMPLNTDNHFIFEFGTVHSDTFPYNTYGGMLVGMSNSSLTVIVKDRWIATGAQAAIVIPFGGFSQLYDLNNHYTIRGKFIGAGGAVVIAGQGDSWNSNNNLSVSLRDVVAIQRVAAKAVIDYRNIPDHVNFSLVNAILVNDGTSDIGPAAAVNVLISNVKASAALPANIVGAGDAVGVVANLNKYFKN